MWVANIMHSEFEQVRGNIADIWEKELNVTGIRPEDEFFALGGDSLNLLNMLFQVKRDLRLSFIPVRCSRTLR